VPAPAVVPSDAPGRRGIVSRWHLVRLGVLVVVALLVAVGISDGRSPDASAEPAVQSFLMDWEQGQYLRAAQLTTGNPAAVALALRTAYNQLDAAAINLNMAGITQTGHSAVARFSATVDLGLDGAAWNYVGWFPLRWTDKGWKIRWSPSVINPGLRAGTRLAVRTTLAPRAQILNASGQSLQTPSTAYELGVRPDKLTDPQATATGLSEVTGLGSSSLLAAMQSGPSRPFLPLVTLDPATYARMRHALHGVPGLVVQPVKRRLFDSIAGDVVGTVGTEVARSFRAEGVAYQPGNTVGLSGLQQYYQRRLVGTPTTEVVVEDDNGHLVSVLNKWSGPAAQPVRTTLSSAAQIAADQALATTSSPAAIVAVQASTGKILAVGRHGDADPLDGHYSPGQAFTIVSTAALLGTGLSAKASIPCNNASDVGGQTFTNHPSSHSLGSQPTFSQDFAYGCSTAFAGLSMRLNASGLSTAAASFGLGSSWRLSLPTFGGSVLAPTSTAQVAADSMGSGDVQVSPLGLAMVAAQVDSGTWHDPSLILAPASADPPVTTKAATKSTVSLQVMTTLRDLMRTTVRSGAARAADLPGVPVYGQAGHAPLPPTASGSPTSSSRGTKGQQTYWFVGYRGNVAFAILEIGKSSSTSAVPLAAQFLRNLPPLMPTAVTRPRTPTASPRRPTTLGARLVRVDHCHAGLGHPQLPGVTRRDVTVTQIRLR
jgi:cell division protein FtsI/penicillin-binding protein 2